MKINNITDIEQIIIQKILSECSLTINEIRLFQSNDRVQDYLLENTFMLRISESKLEEIKKLHIVGAFKGVQRVHFYGNIEVSNKRYFYLILDFFIGVDLYETIPSLTDKQSIKIGKELAETLKRLHQIKGDHYDIGHYIPTIPNFKFSWKKGHLAYIELLYSQITSLNLSMNFQKVIESAFTYMYNHIDSLDYENGPVFLHNDLHPKNIIIRQNQYIGVIDWECSQFGEYDFDFVHLLQWCIYPNEPRRSFKKLLKAVFDNYERLYHIPRLPERFTIYQLEHEMNQLVWNKGKDIEDRAMRITGWISGKIEQFMKND